MKSKIGIIKKSISRVKIELNKWLQYLIIFGLILLISLLFPSGKSLQYSYQLSDITNQPIIAPYTFPILKTAEKYKTDLNNQLKSVPFIFNRDDEMSSIQLNNIDDFFVKVKKLRLIYWKLFESRQLMFERKYHSSGDKAKLEFIADSTKLLILLEKFKNNYDFVNVNDSLWYNYLNIEIPPKSLTDLKMHRDIVKQICKNRWAEGIYDIESDSVLSKKIKLNQGTLPLLIYPKEINSLEEAWIKSKEEFLNENFEREAIQNIGYSIIIEFMKPNILYDRQNTKIKQQESLSKVPRSKGVVLKNELIVDANIRITSDVLQKLNSLSEFVTNDKQSGDKNQFWNYLGRLILISIVISLFFTYLYIYRLAVFEDWKMVLLISIIFFLQLGMAHVIVMQIQLSEYLIPISVGAMALTILFDARLGFMGIVVMATMMSLMMGQNIDFLIVSLFTSTVAIYNIRELRKRGQLFFTMFALMASSIIVVLALGLFKEHLWSHIIYDMQLIALNSFFAPLLTYGLIMIFETFFEITTNLTLIELLDYDHPLLKRAQRESNGTFNHSIVVGNLAEACAAAIGGHSLLCRVGAYYHDIGKMKKPDYFIENQFSGKNMHDSLKHTMSARIIRNHVNDGLQLAKEYGLPKIVSDFIPMHHGTTRVEYFYRMAVEEAGGDSSKVDESQFRYPGPKPNTKETGILMICEAIEAAVRSIKNPDIIKIEAMIDKIIKQRIEDKQLNECPLTLDELRRIKGTVDGKTGLLPVLRGIYHIRIEYPDEK